MSTLDPTLESPVVGEATSTGRGDSVAAVGVLTTSDHKTIGKLLVGGSLLGLIAVATVAVILGIERVDGDGTLLDPDDLSQLFAAYRVGLVEAVVLPLLLGISVLVVPLQLGARALAFPRAAAAGLWTWFGGTVLLVISLANNGGPLGGDSNMVELYLGGNVLVLVGLTAVAVSVATSALTTRAPGMRLHRAPLFSWAALVGTLALVLVLPVAVGSNILQFVDYRYGGAAFDGSSGIWPWTSYLYTGPFLGVAAVFAAGFVADVVAVTFRKRFPHRAIALIGIGLIGTAAFAGIAQQDVITLPGTGSEVRLENFATKLGFAAVWAGFTLLPVLGVVIIMGISALAAKPESRRRGDQESRNDRPARPNFNAALLFGFFGLGLALLGMLGAAVTGIEDLGLEGTVFEEGAAVATIYGAVLAGIGAGAYWFAKASGRKLPELPLGGLASLGALGGALASVPYFIAGFLDQPAASASWDNDGPGELLNALVVAGHAAVGLTALAFFGFVAKSWRSGDEAGDDPWGGQTLEWATTSPPPADNFATTPTVMSPEPLLDLKAKPEFAEEEFGTELMHALPPAPAPPPRRQVLIGTAVVSMGVLTLVGGLLAVYIRLREDARDADEPWVPESVSIPGVPTNVMLISFFVLVLFAQWTVYAARRRDRVHIGLSLGLVGLVGLAIVNAQAYVYNRMALPAADSTFASMFYAVTGTMTALVVVGLVFTVVTAFRLLGGRESDQEIVAAHALYWYVLTAAFSALWLIVYVSK